MTELNHAQLVDLRDKLLQFFNDSELRSLCFELGEEYENLEGQAKPDKALSLVQRCQRTGQMRELLARCAAHRPQVAWPTPGGAGAPPPAPPSGGISFSNVGVKANQIMQGGTVNVGSAIASGGGSSAVVNAPSGAVPRPPAPEVKITILFLAANPKDTRRLRLDEEVRTIDEKLRLAEFRDRFVLQQAYAVRVGDISGALFRYKPHVVHFSGHGSRSGELIFEDVTGASKPVTAQALAGLFRAIKDNVRCVVMNACWSDHQAEAITQEIDCVVGMSRAISDPAAIAAGFYESLGYGKSVKVAHGVGCARIDLQSLPEAATPRLKTKDGVDADQVKFA